MSETLTMKEAANRLKINVMTLRRMVDRGEITPFRVGHQLRLTQSDLDTYIEKSRLANQKEASA